MSAQSCRHIAWFDFKQLDALCWQWTELCWLATWSARPPQWELPHLSSPGNKCQNPIMVNWKRTSTILENQLAIILWTHTLAEQMLSHNCGSPATTYLLNRSSTTRWSAHWRSSTQFHTTSACASPARRPVHVEDSERTNKPCALLAMPSVG